MRIRVLILFLFLFLAFVHAQKASYKILIGNHYAGELKVEQNNNDSVTEIYVISDVDFQFIISIRFKYVLHSIYKNGILQKSKVVTYVNDDVHSVITTLRTGNLYVISKNGKEKSILGEFIYSGALLYFKEPENMSYLYSEIEGVKKEITEAGNHTYILKDPQKSRTDDYIYEDGLLKSALIRYPLMNFKIVRN